ncbi:hypothetical protein LWI28_019821 [Acer negundo]|uniref:Uncharacterized protein n=1 Tax=Acer negundo TaxID=4023 RepID=A0AAD5JEW8_ACENE|nr:hypothetical protein LWI28_019821 [Acer negundo]
MDMVGRGSEGFEAGEGVQLVKWLSMDKIGSARGVKVDLRAVGMDIDKGVSKIIGSDAVVGSVEPAKTQVGPKAGKWKMWARDGVKTDGGMDGDSSLGKCKVDKGDSNMGRKKKKMAIVEGDSCLAGGIGDRGGRGSWLIWGGGRIMGLMGWFLWRSKFCGEKDRWIWGGGRRFVAKKMDGLGGGSGGVDLVVDRCRFGGGC